MGTADQSDYADLQIPTGSYAGETNTASPYSNKGSSTTTGTPKSPAPANGEVNVLAYFAWRPPIDGKTEIDYLLQGKWHPSYLDYQAIAGPTSFAPADFNALLGMIATFAPNSIHRLNFFTHANQNMIGITGYLDPTDVYFTSLVAEADIGYHLANDLTYTFQNSSFQLKDVRARFAPGAIFVLYGCKVGFDPTTLLTGLRDLLEVTTIGFGEKIVFCPPAQTSGSSVFNRTGEKMGIYKPGFSCGTDSTSDWRSLINDPKAVKVPKASR